MDKREEFTETVKSAIKTEEDLGTVDEEGSWTETAKSTIKKEENLGTADKEEDLETAEEDGAGPQVVKVLRSKVADDLGELELGKLDQEFFNDPGLRAYWPRRL
ncbi:hypothetical protein OS493_025628 [Desmophyllum pertusum]|uniref:Uncharacterized protein n=1 Tax=Desmophyllum pertusum TaxID=174260 RepID=A0A9W9ZZ20_9CNID|nr:hypothetical protein OS493_025628 [Desmophyllum pertusum]